MIRYSLHALAIGVLIILEGVLSGSFSNPTPFLPSVIVAAGLARVHLHGFGSAILWVLAVGFVADIVLSATFGTSLLALLLAAYGLSLFSRRTVTGSNLSGRILLTVYAVGSTFAYWHIHIFSTTGGVSREQYLHWLFSNAISLVWQLLLTIVMFWVVLYIMKKMGMRKRIRIGNTMPS